MEKVLELTEGQKEFIQERFVGGKKLFDKVVTFEDGEHVIRLCLGTRIDSGIAVCSSYYSDLVWVNAYSERVFIEFRKEVSK